MEVPLISIQPCEDTGGAIQHALASLRDYHWLVFTSVNGVEIFFQRLLDFGLSEDMLEGRSIAAIGPATAQALEQHGLPVDLMPQEHLTSGIVRTMGGLDLHGERVLLPRAEEGSRDLPPGLEALGAEVTHISLYRTEIPRDAGARVQKALQAGLDVVTFTSPLRCPQHRNRATGPYGAIGPNCASLYRSGYRRSSPASKYEYRRCCI